MLVRKIAALAVPIAGLALLAQQSKKIDDAALKSAAKGGGEEWLTYGLSQGETRYSTLSQLNASNVGRLGLAWSYELGAGGGGQEATPLVWNGTIFGITNWSVVFAVDARTGKEKWRWDPEVNKDAVRPKLCCGVVNRGIALYNGMIIAPVNDGRLDAINAETGKVVWEARVAFPQENYTLTMAPRIAKGKVIIGVSGAEFPVRGFFSAFDANTGQFLWKFYTTPGDPSKPFESSAMRKASTTWESDAWKMGGGATVWDGFAYDPESDLIYVGTGNGGPWPEQVRNTQSKTSQGKDNLYVASILAVQPATGEMKWYYQMVPGDSWDFDSVQQMILTDLTINGKTRKVIMQANKNGFFYVLDRVTGQFISAQPFAQVTWAKGIDQTTGRPIVNPEAYYGKESVQISPGPGGAHNWSPMSYNPATGLVYIPTTTGSSFNFSADPDFKFQQGKQNMGLKGFGFGPPAPGAPPPPTPIKPSAAPVGPAPIEGQRGALIAWDPIAQKERWRANGGGSIGGGTVSTAGNLVFHVIPDGHVYAYSADKGEKLWEVQTNLRGGMGPPVTFQLDGKQYLTVMGGTGAVRFPGPPPGAAAPGAGGATAVNGIPVAGAAGAAPAAPGAAPTAAPGAPPAAGAGGGGGGGFGFGGPVAQPKLLTFVLDGKAELPAAPPPVAEPAK